MSDYGFATYDDRTGKIAQKINSKYPIFGPEYSGISAQYRTTNIIETVQNSPGPIEELDDWPDRNIQFWDGYWVGKAHVSKYRDVLISRYNHNLGKRPLCYFWVTGTVVQNCRCQNYQYLADGSSSYGGSFDQYKTFSRTGKVGPAMNYMVQLDIPEGFIWQNQYVAVRARDYGYDPTSDIEIPNACFPAFSDARYNDSVVIENQDNLPYYAVADDKEVRIYRRHWWSDHMCRVGSRSGNPDARQRTKCIIDYAGTNVEITVYLVPYNLEDLG